MFVRCPPTWRLATVAKEVGQLIGFVQRVYSYLKQMQEMEKHKRFCRVCCDPLDRKYALLTVSGQLTIVGQVVVGFLSRALGI